MKHVANNHILSDQEARGLLIHLNGTKPDPPLVFIQEQRLGIASLVEFKCTSITTINLNFPGGTYCTLQFNVNNMAGLVAEIKEVHFSNPADFPIDNIQIFVNGAYTNCDRVEKIVGKVLHGHPVYKAIFEKPVTYHPTSYQAQVYFRTKTYSGLGTGALINGDSYNQTVTISGESYDITLPDYSSTAWYFLVGLIMKVRKGGY